MKYNKKIFIIIIFLGILFFTNKIYNLFYNIKCEDFQNKVLEGIEKQDSINLKSIVSSEWDKMYILDLSENIDLYSEKYNIDFSNINLPYRDRKFYQLIVFLKGDKIIKYGYLENFTVYFKVNSDEDRVIFNDETEFKVNKEQMYKYILYR